MKPLLVEYEISVATYDIDFAGHVSNIAYLRWLEDMRLKVFDEYFPLEKFIQDGLAPVLVSTQIEYKKPVHLFDKPRGVMWVPRIGKASFIMQGEIRVNGELTTTATHIGVFVEVSTQKAVRLPQVCVTEFQRSAAARD